MFPSKKLLLKKEFKIKKPEESRLMKNDDHFVKENNELGLFSIGTICDELQNLSSGFLIIEKCEDSAKIHVDLKRGQLGGLYHIYELIFKNNQLFLSDNSIDIFKWSNSQNELNIANAIFKWIVKNINDFLKYNSRINQDFEKFIWMVHDLSSETGVACDVPSLDKISLIILQDWKIPVNFNINGEILEERLSLSIDDKEFQVLNEKLKIKSALPVLDVEKESATKKRI